MSSLFPAIPPSTQKFMGRTMPSGLFEHDVIPQMCPTVIVGISGGGNKEQEFLEMTVFKKYVKPKSLVFPKPK